MSVKDGAVRLIGTVHLDPGRPVVSGSASPTILGVGNGGGFPRVWGGFTVLQRLLEDLHPELISSDVSPFAVEFRRSRGPELLKRLDRYRDRAGELPPGLAPVAAQLEIPFEVRAIEAFCAQSGSRYQLLGDSDDSRRRLVLFETELLDPGNLDRLAREPLPPLADQVERSWGRAFRWFHQGVLPITPAWLLDEDTRMAGFLRALPPDANHIHVTGWEHLPGLERLLGLPRSQVRLLADSPPHRGNTTTAKNP